MPKKNLKKPKKPVDPKRSQEPNKPDPDREQPTTPEGEGNEHDVHREILERRMRGGPKPDQESYERALEQWKNLPGSVIRPPTDIKQTPEERSKRKDKTSQPDDNNEEPSEPDNDDKSDEEDKP